MIGDHMNFAEARGWVAVLCVTIMGCRGCNERKLCSALPEGGCPLSRGGTCSDLQCSALYACMEGAWELYEQCADATSSASLSTSGSGGCGSVAIDVADEAEGCMPDLQPPDCPHEVLESCRPCGAECIDFYACTRSGWLDVAYCTEAGNVVVVRN